MTTLFTSVQEDLKSFLESLSPEDIQDKVNSATYYKGIQYYEWELVSDVLYSYDKSRLTALVAGSMDYDVLIALQQGNVTAGCSCPVEGVCKHITAVLLYTIDEANAVEVGENREEGSLVYQHLQTLSKEELVSTVLKYAPEEFLLEIHNRHASRPEALSIYNKAEAAIRKLFSNTELLYSPYEFSDALEKIINRLLGLEHKLQDELSELIFYIIRETENALEIGYLYDDDYDTTFEQPEAFNTLVEQYAKALPYDAKISFLKQLEEVLQDSSQDTFDSLSSLGLESFEEDELPAVKTVLLNEYKDLPLALTEQYYALVRQLLSEQEKEAILLYLKEEDNSWLLELADLYREQGREREALETVRKLLTADGGMYAVEPVYLLYLDLLKSQGGELKEACDEAINRCATRSILEKIAELSGEDTRQYERLLEQKNPQELLEYYEKNGRLTDALSLLKRSDNIWDHPRYTFFKKYKKEFPEDAVQYFTDVINKNLEYTGNSHYHTIAEALKQIRQVNPEQASAIAADIRTNYNRRHNLMNLLAEV